MDRPARVFIRARNPCFRFLRRVLGWNVRFVIGIHLELSALCDSPVRGREIAGVFWECWRSIADGCFCT
jgi:hypothetical protein